MQCKEDCEEVRLELPSEPSSIKRARDAVAALAHRVGVPVPDVKLAVSEAVSNSVTHAFRDRPQGTISVRARIEGAGWSWSSPTTAPGCGRTPTAPGSG